MVPGAFEIIAAAQKAPMNRTTRIVAMFSASAQGSTKMTNRPRAIIYTGLRPYISDRGARTMEPQAMPRRYVVTPRIPVLSLIPNSSIRPGIADVYDVEYSTTVVVLYDMTAIMTPLNHSGQANGLSLSSSSKSTSKAMSVVAFVAVLLFVLARWSCVGMIPPIALVDEARDKCGVRVFSW